MKWHLSWVDLRCGTMAANNGSEDSPFARCLGNMHGHCGEHRHNTSPVEFWAHDGTRMTGAIDPFSMPHRAETAEEKQRELDKQDAFFVPRKAKHPATGYQSLLEVRQEAANSNGSGTKPLRTKPDPPPNPIEAVNEAIRITVERGCDTCIIVAHREAIKDLKSFCNHGYRVRLPYCAIGTFGARLKTNNDRTSPHGPIVKYNFWNAWPYQAFGRHSIPRYLPSSPGYLRLMMTDNDNPGSIDIICYIRTMGWSCSLPPEAWAKPMKDEKFCPPWTKPCHVEAELPNAYDRDVLLKRLVYPLASNNHVLAFESVVFWNKDVMWNHKKNKPVKQTLRFRFSRQYLSGPKVLLWYCVI